MCIPTYLNLILKLKRKIIILVAKKVNDKMTEKFQINKRMYNTVNNKLLFTVKWEILLAINLAFFIV